MKQERMESRKKEKKDIISYKVILQEYHFETSESKNNEPYSENG